MWVQLAAMRELAARRPQGRAGVSDFSADEIAAEFRLSWESAAGQVVYACAVATRLPRTFAALAAGKIHPVHARIIEDETRVLTPSTPPRPTRSWRRRHSRRRSANCGTRRTG